MNTGTRNAHGVRDAETQARRSAAAPRWRANLDRELDVECRARAGIAAIVAVALLGVATAVADATKGESPLTADARAAAAVEAARD